MKKNKNKKTQINPAIEKVEKISEANAALSAGGTGNVGLWGLDGINAGPLGVGGYGGGLNGMGINGGVYPAVLFEHAEEPSTYAEQEREEIEKRGVCARAQKASDTEKPAYKSINDKKDGETHRDKRDKNGGGNNSGGYIAAIAGLSAAVLVLGSVLCMSLFTDRINVGQPTASTTDSQRAYYDFVGYVDNMETNMSKLFVSSDSSGQQRILGDIAVQSNLADAALSLLPMKDESRFRTSKYINQVGDYAKYLNNRLIDGQMLSEEDYSRLGDLYRINRELRVSLSDLTGDALGGGYDFSSLANG
ncbi:MAG: germination protein YpeB, partial [Clostridia bacterium]|nr:germination protein YpeB [Clostridia bacterium]